MQAKTAWSLYVESAKVRLGPRAGYRGSGGGGISGMSQSRNGNSGYPRNSVRNAVSTVYLKLLREAMGTVPAAHRQQLCEAPGEQSLTLQQ